MTQVRLTDREVIITLEEHDHDIPMHRVLAIPYKNVEQIYFILEDILYQKGNYGREEKH